ncbi:unnamed protein product [Caenorhabditis brenneri]
MLLEEESQLTFIMGVSWNSFHAQQTWRTKIERRSTQASPIKYIPLRDMYARADEQHESSRRDKEIADHRRNEANNSILTDK